MKPSILDTNMIGPLFEKNPKLLRLTEQHKLLYGSLYITSITCYEVMRGLNYSATSPKAHERRMARQGIEQFETFCYKNKVLNFH